MKREIKAHKGGRDARLEVRIKSDLKRRLKAICQKAGISEADWIEKQIESSGSTPRKDEE